MHLSLVGLPGCGKSTIGKQLARQCGMPFFDLDFEIEKKLAIKIKDYFASHGEECFRDIESQALKDLLDQKIPMVLATGGGAILRPENRQLLRTQSKVFYLKTPAKEIAQRLSADTTRPLMQGHDPLQKLTQLLVQREPLYLQVADYVIDASGQNTASVGKKLAMQAELAGLVNRASS